MVALPPNSTDRHWLDYTTGRHAHSMMIRTSAPLTEVNALSFFSQFLAALNPILPDEWAVTGARRASAGSDITLPVNVGSLGAYVGGSTNNLAAVDEPRQLVFVGRSNSTGRRWALSLYGALFTTPDTYRFAGEGIPAVLQDALDVLTEFETTLECIDGSHPNVYDYINVNYNSYWETERRG